MRDEPDGAARAKLRERLIAGHLVYLRWIVKWCARVMRKNQRMPTDIEEMWSQASLVLCRCVDTFNPEMGIPFRGFVKTCVLRSLAVSAYQDEQVTTVAHHARQNLFAWRKLHRKTGISLEDYAKRLPYRAGRCMLSLAALDGRESREIDSLEAQFDPSLRTESRDYELADCRDLVSHALDVLTPEEREFLRLIYWEGHSVSSLARRIGVNPNTMHYRKEAMLARLRKLWPELVA
jgi:RNA polymerase sigma factor (sigma-70 family)